MEKVSVVIPTYNRFDLLMDAIESVKKQTYKNIEVIVINDRSTEEAYYNYDYPDVNILHLSKGSKERHGRVMPGSFPRNMGIIMSQGDYIAFLDDDDLWMPEKIEMQLDAMKENNCDMCCSEGYIGSGRYDDTKSYPRYNEENYHAAISDIFKSKNSSNLFPVPETSSGFPKVWDLNFLSVHNCCVTSSVMISKSQIQKTGFFKIMNFAEDYEYWKRVLENTNCAYVETPLFYYNTYTCHNFHMN